MDFLKIVVLALVAVSICHGADKVWLINIGHDFGAHEYIDESGYLKGFAYDMVEGVCKAGKMICKTIWDKYTNCWNSPAGVHPFGGQGIHDKWYDGCLGWWQTIERLHVFKFSAEYGKTPNSHFYVKPGNPEGFDKADITGKTIGFRTGWATDEKCLARMDDSVTGAFLPEGSVMHAEDASALVELIKNGGIDAAFCDEDSMASYVADGKVDKIALDYACLIGGNSMFARKDSELIDLWDAGFAAFKASGGYKEICDAAATTHGAYGTIDCVD